MLVTLFALLMPLFSLNSLGDLPAVSSAVGDLTQIVTIKTSAKQAWLGVTVEDYTQEKAKSKATEAEQGALVAKVTEKSPADSAGIRNGDIIVEFSGKAIAGADDLVKAVGKAKPGTKASVTLIRDGERKSLQVTLGKYPKSRETKVIASARSPRRFDILIGDRMLGMDLMELNEQLGEYFQAPNDEGVLVKQVEKGSAAEKAGFKAGDVIIKFGTKSINDVGDVSRALGKYEKGDKVEVEVVRKGSRVKLTVEIENKPGWPSFNHLNQIAPDLESLGQLHLEGSLPDPKILEYEIQSHLKPELKRFKIQMRKFGEEQKEQMKELRKQIRIKMEI
jgi:predicted metalloprotease with PDZ domain